MPQLKIDFTRHGHSCANMAEEHGGRGLYLKFREKDPRLSALGLAKAEEVAIDIKNTNPQGLIGVVPDVVMSSGLSRAIQTAYIMWPQASKIIVAPFLLEHGFDTENKPPADSNTQSTILAQHFPLLPAKLKRYEQSSTAPGDLAKFMIWLRGSFLGHLSGTHDIVIAVVTHSRLMHTDLQLSTKPANQSIYRVAIDFDVWNQFQRPLVIKTQATIIYKGITLKQLTKQQIRQYEKESTDCQWFGKM